MYTCVLHSAHASVGMLIFLTQNKSQLPDPEQTKSKSQERLIVNKPLLVWMCEQLIAQWVGIKIDRAITVYHFFGGSKANWVYTF